MKKILLAGTAAMSLLFMGCGASWDVAKKEGIIVDKYLEREIKVYNDFTGELEYEYKGKGYVQLRNDGVCINVTILDKKTNEKVDIIGSGVHIISRTIED